MDCPICRTYHDTTACPTPMLAHNTAIAQYASSWWHDKTLMFNEDGTITVDGQRYTLVRTERGE